MNKQEILNKTNSFKSHNDKSYLKNNIIIGIKPRCEIFYNYDRLFPITKKFNKVFCIGLNKTGTSSIHIAFQNMGLTSFHGGSYDERIDCFSDGRYYKYFKEFDQIAPNSKFILNTRNLKSWIMSRIKHCQYVGPMPDWEGDKVCNVNRILEWIKQREELHLEIKEYFKNRNSDLLIFDVCAGDGYEKLCNFLELPVIPKSFPKKNTGNKKPKLNKQMIDFIKNI